MKQIKDELKSPPDKIFSTIKLEPGLQTSGLKQGTSGNVIFASNIPQQQSQQRPSIIRRTDSPGIKNNFHHPQGQFITMPVAKIKQEFHGHQAQNPPQNQSHNQGQMIQHEMVQGQRIQGRMVQGQMINGQLVQGQMVQSQNVQGQNVQGQNVQGHIIRGQSTQGQIVRGQTQSQPRQSTSPNSQQHHRQVIKEAIMIQSNLNKGQQQQPGNNLGAVFGTSQYRY